MRFRTPRAACVAGFCALWMALGQTPAVEMAEGDRLYGAGRFAEASVIYAKLREAAPRNADLALRLGACRYQLGDYAGAETSFRAALAVIPGMPPALKGHGTALVALGRFAEAVAPLEQAVKSSPSDLDAKRALAHAYAESGRILEGEPLLRALTARDPRDAQAWTWLGLLFFGQDFAAPAIEAFDRALALDPKNRRAAIYRAGALIQAGRMAEARDALNRLNEDESLASDPEYLLGRSLYLHQTGQLAEALESLETALAHNKPSAKLLYWRARVLADLGRSADALTAAEQALTTTGGDTPGIRLLLVRLYRALGSPEKAAVHTEWLKARSEKKAKGASR